MIEKHSKISNLCVNLTKKLNSLDQSTIAESYLPIYTHST